jgi:hypothetical protein
MIFILCASCRCALRVTGDLEEIHPLVGQGSSFWPDKFICYKCEGPAQGFLEAEIELKASVEIKEVSPQEAYAAIHGLGVLEEREVDLVTVRELMATHPVRRVTGKDVMGVARVVVDFVELWDGTRLHFGSSNEGAVVYRITRPHSYVEVSQRTCLGCKQRVNDHHAPGCLKGGQDLVVTVQQATP